MRSGALESVHRGSIAVCDSSGHLLAHAGDPALPVFWRSAAKLHQAIPLVMRGAIERWQLSDAELAIICGSHNGEPEQVRCVASVLNRIGLDESALHCGSQEPFGHDAANELIRSGAQPGPLHNTCSGNHTGLLALTRLLQAEAGSYDLKSNPAQQRALELVAKFAGHNSSEVFTGVDGCGIPAYRTPLSSLATAFARLMRVPADWEPGIADAVARIIGAVARQPTFISGAGELDCECVRAFGGAAICKFGAEGVLAAAFRPSERFPAGVGIALKIEDGLGTRARDVAFAEVLRQLELGTVAQRTALNLHIEHDVKTRRGQMVGRISPVFTLEFAR